MTCDTVEQHTRVVYTSTRSPVEPCRRRRKGTVVRRWSGDGLIKQSSNDEPATGGQWFGYQPPLTLTVPAVLYADLQCAPLLHTLHLNLCCNSIANAGARALASLKKAPLLHTLHLDLSHNKIECAGAQALAGLQDAQFLHTLHLNLCRNRIASAGALALDSLKPTAQLHTLDVNIGITAD